MLGIGLDNGIPIVPPRCNRRIRTPASTRAAALSGGVLISPCRMISGRSSIFFIFTSKQIIPYLLFSRQSSYAGASSRPQHSIVSCQRTIRSRDYLKTQTSNLKHQTSNFKPQTSNLSSVPWQLTMEWCKNCSIVRLFDCRTKHQAPGTKHQAPNNRRISAAASACPSN